MRKLILLATLCVCACAPTPPAPHPGCVVYNAQFCVSKAHKPIASDGAWHAAFPCYEQHGRCEAKSDGSCGWTPTPALQACLANPPSVRNP